MPLAQIRTRRNQFVTVRNTAWLYPIADIEYVLSRSTRSFRRDGSNLICANLATVEALYTDIYNRTAVTQPVPNQGYTLGVGTSLDDLGKEMRFMLEDGTVVIVWRLVKQLTRQSPYTEIPAPGNSPPETIGYITTYASYNGYPAIDNVMVVRVG